MSYLQHSLIVLLAFFSTVLAVSGAGIWEYSPAAVHGVDSLLEETKHIDDNNPENDLDFVADTAELHETTEVLAGKEDIGSNENEQLRQSVVFTSSNDDLRSKPGSELQSSSLLRKMVDSNDVTKRKWGHYHPPTLFPNLDRFVSRTVNGLCLSARIWNCMFDNHRMSHKRSHSDRKSTFDVSISSISDTVKQKDGQTPDLRSSNKTNFNDDAPNSRGINLSGERGKRFFVHDHGYGSRIDAARQLAKKLLIEDNVFGKNGPGKK